MLSYICDKSFIIQTKYCNDLYGSLIFATKVLKCRVSITMTYRPKSYIFEEGVIIQKQCYNDVKNEVLGLKYDNFVIKWRLTVILSKF